MSIDIKNLIDINDGWVTCSLSDVDIYRRLLVNIYIDIPSQKINLYDFLLERMESDTDPILHKYDRNAV